MITIMIIVDNRSRNNKYNINLHTLTNEKKKSHNNFTQLLQRPALAMHRFENLVDIMVIQLQLSVLKLEQVFYRTSFHSSQ